MSSHWMILQKAGETTALLPTCNEIYFKMADFEKTEKINLINTNASMMSRYSHDSGCKWSHGKGVTKSNTPVKIMESIPYMWIHSHRHLLLPVMFSSKRWEHQNCSWKAFKSLDILTCGKAASKWFRLSFIIQGENSSSIFSKGCQTF